MSEIKAATQGAAVVERTLSKNGDGAVEHLQRIVSEQIPLFCSVIVGLPAEKVVEIIGQCGTMAHVSMLHFISQHYHEFNEEDGERVSALAREKLEKITSGYLRGSRGEAVQTASLVASIDPELRDRLKIPAICMKTAGEFLRSNGKDGVR